MTDGFFFLLTALVIGLSNALFYFLGRFVGREQQVIREVRKQLAKPPKEERVDPGPIDYIPPSMEGYHGSEQEKIDIVTRELVDKNFRNPEAP